MEAMDRTLRYKRRANTTRQRRIVLRDWKLAETTPAGWCIVVDQPDEAIDQGMQRRPASGEAGLRLKGRTLEAD